MAFWHRWFGGARGKSSALDLVRTMFANSSKSGQNVTRDNALQVQTVLACVRVLAEGVSQVPLKLYREDAAGRTRTPAKDLKLYQVLAAKPNAWMTSFEFRETMMFHAVLAGDFYAFKNVVGGEIVELIPFEPDRVSVKRNARTLDLTYEVRGDSGSVQAFPAEAIWHVRGPSWNSYTSIGGAVKLAREAIGLAMGLETSHAAYHKNRGRVSGLLAVEGALKTEGYAELRDWIEKEYTGPENDGKVMIMDRAAKFTPMVATGIDAQHLETRRHQREEICLGLRVMPIMIGISDKTTTYASAEQMFIAHVVHTLTPWYTRIEQSIDANLLGEAERDAGVYAKFNANGLLRGAMADRSQWYANALGSGGAPAWMEINEVRALEEMDAVAWGDGKPQSSNQTPPPADVSVEDV